MTLKVGMIGVGDIALKNYLPGTAALMPQVEMVAACDTVPQHVEHAAEQFGIPRTYTRVPDLLADPEVAAVQVLTPWPYHFKIALEALKAGKHVYVQKPMAQTKEEADQLIEEAERRGVILAAAPPSMLSPTMQRIKQLVQDGVIGKVSLVYSHSSHGGPSGHNRHTDSRWFFSKEAGPWTSLVDMGVYGLHSVTGIMGPAKRVTAFAGISQPKRTFSVGGTMTFTEGRREEADVTSADNGIVMLDWGDGRIGTVDGAFTMIQRVGPGLTLYGSAGVIASAGRSGTFSLYLQSAAGPFPAGWSEVDENGTVVASGEGSQPGAGGQPARAFGAPLAPAATDRGPAEDIKHWAEAITEGKSLILTAQHARHVIEIMEKAPLASETGRTQELTTTF
jgi:predicted dehydrogenase